MSTIQCPNCKKHTPTSYPECLGCGNKLIITKSPTQVSIEKPIYQKKAEGRERVISILFFLFFAAGIWFFLSPSDNSNISLTEESVKNNKCPAIYLSGSAYLTSPDWFQRNEHCLNSAQKQQMEKELYLTVKKLPARKIQQNRDGYKGLSILNNKKPEYKKKLAYYSAKLNKANKNDKYSNKISPYALSPYTKKGYPKTVAKYKSRLKEIEKYRRKVSEMAIDSGKCDYVEIVQLSTKSSLNKLKFWVDCRNKQRIYLTENEIDTGATVQTQADKSWTRQGATQACEKAIKQRTLIPSELDIHSFIGTSFYKAPISHNAVLKVNFDANNAFGIEMAYMATCHFIPGEVGTIEIQKR